MYLIINKWVIAVKVSNFFGQYLRNHRTMDIGVLGYIGIVWPKEHSPEVWSVPPGTPCVVNNVCVGNNLWINYVTQHISEGDYNFSLQKVIYYWSVTGVSHRWWYGGRHFNRDYVNMAWQLYNNLITVLLIKRYWLK